MTTSLTIPANTTRIWKQIQVAVLTTTFLFFIDEGAYNFQWALLPGNWIPFAVYCAFLLAGQVVADRFILKKYRGNSKGLLTAIIGLPLGLFIPFIIGYLIVPLFL